MSNTLGIQAKYRKHTLHFKFDAGTSRGVLRSKDTYFVEVWQASNSAVVGLGEAGPLPKLSPDDIPDFEIILKAYANGLASQSIPWSEEGILQFCTAYVDDRFPSIRFAFETALLDLFYGGKRRICPNPFYEGGDAIPINGLIWMGEVAFMQKQIEDKLEAGFNCIKIKIGAIDFDQEYSLLEGIRARFSKEEITLRVDANGAFKVDEAISKLKRLSQLDLHSIEQPIKAGQVMDMAELCKESPLPVALDEELIGVMDMVSKRQLLETIRPPYIILKPTLLGGIAATNEWIALADEYGIGWWMTSALESNIGLNAIAQLTSTYDVDLPQGLGTGQLYHNNIGSPLTVKDGMLFYDSQKAWDKLD